MTLFELIMGITTVILGLALTQLVSNFHRLMMAGRRVRWAPEPLILSGIIFMVIIDVWLVQWSFREWTKTTMGEVILQVLKMLSPFMASAFVLPDKISDQGEIDLYRHYDRTRVFAYSALILGLLLFWIDIIIRRDTGNFGSIQWLAFAVQRAPYVIVPTYAALIFIRSRWFNILVLLAILLGFSWLVIPIVLSQ